MKKSIIPLLILLSSFSIGQKEINFSNLKYIDTLKKYNCIIERIDGELNEIETTIGTAYSNIYRLDYLTIDSLFFAEEGIIKLYSFLILCDKYPDKVDEKYSTILENNNLTNIYSRDKFPYPTRPTKIIAQKIKNNSQNKSIEEKNKLAVELSVKEFILNYSKYPDTYQPLSFEDFQSVESYNITEKKQEPSAHVIKHIYTIKDNQGNIVNSTLMFILNSQLRIEIIEEEIMDIFESNPPDIQGWLNMFGRKLTLEDEKKLGLK